MSSPSLQAEGGFVRVPRAWIYLPITPQAKALLMAFCAHADELGKSWCSYQQLGDMLCRSKASVSTYVQELQDAGLIECRKQRFGNGFNYRLLITLAGWADLLEHWSKLSSAKKARTKECNGNIPSSRESVRPSTRHAPEAGPDGQVPSRPPAARQRIPSRSIAVSQAERSSQPAERKDPSGPIIQIHQTKTPAVVWTEKDEAAWRSFRPSDRDPMDVTGARPCPDLLRKVVAHADDLKKALGILEPQEAQKAATEALRNFCTAHSLRTSRVDLDQAGATLGQIARTPGALTAAIEALEGAWQPHWKRLSSPDQMIRTCSDPAGEKLPSKEERRLAGRFQDRAWIAGKHLRRIEPSDSLRSA